MRAMSTGDQCVPLTNCTYHMTLHECVTWSCTQAVINSSLVHHMILYACSATPATLGASYDCAPTPAGCATFTIGELQCAEGAP